MSETGISLDATLPLSWMVESPLSSSTLEQRRHGNISLLKALAVIETATQERDETPEAVRKHLERVESKLDVLLMLVAKLALDATQLPADCDVMLSPAQIAWQTQEALLPTAGQTVTIKLFLSPRVPQPLVLQAIVREAGAGETHADLQEIDDELEEWLTRTIFRHHRRAVHARKQP